MSYRVYITDGIILAKKDFNEADRLYFIFTKEFGMIKAIAQGVRYIKSKLRFNLDLFSFCNFSLVKTKDSWRIIDAEEKQNLHKIISDPQKLKFFSRIAVFLTRMIKGEEKNDFIWNELVFLPDRFGEKDAEILFVAKVLKNLGYLSDDKLPKKELIASINRAIKESML